MDDDGLPLAAQQDESSGLASGKGLGNQAYEALLDLIFAGELKPGDVMQERALALQLGISRTPLREAMHRLEGERMLERQSNNRLVVRHVTLQEIMEALHVRRLLESDAAGRAAGNIPRERLIDLRTRIERLRESEDPSNPEHQALDAELHALIADANDNQLVAAMIADLRRKTRLYSLKRVTKRLRPVCDEHLAIVDALYAGDAEAAARETSRHIEQIRQSVIDSLAGR